MHEEIIRGLIELNNTFYRQHAASFSATRSAAWHGWGRLAELLSAELPARLLDGTETLRVADIACGNLRLVDFLIDAFPHAAIEYHGIDVQPALIGSHERDLPERVRVTTHEEDVLDGLLDAAGADPLANLPACHVTCSFGFMHHVPDMRLREAVLAELVRHTAPGGIVSCSLWQFMHDARLARKAGEAEQRAAADPPFASYRADALEPGDHLLPWQDSEGLRYCHHFEEGEVDRLVASLPVARVRELSRFFADGRTGDLNRYLVLRACS